MKKILLILMFLPSIVFAKKTLEMNLLTEHFFLPCELSERFSNKVGDCGNLINNKLIGINEDLGDSLSFRGFLGENSVGSLMLGGMFSNVSFKGGFDYGPVLGVYLQDGKEFKRRNIKIFGISQGDIDLIPIIGAEFQYKIKDYKLFTVVTPVLATLGLGFDF